MVRFILFLSAVLIGLTAFHPISAQETKIPLSAYGELPDVERAVLSPSGNRIALITTIKGTRAILAIENQQKVISTMAVGDMKIRDLEWIGEDRLLLISSQTEELGNRFTTDQAEFYAGTILPISQEAKAGIVFSKQKNLVSKIFGNYGIRQVGGKYYGYFGAVVLKKVSGSRLNFSFDHGRPYLYRVDLQDYSTKKVANAPSEGVDREWEIGADGEIAARLDVNEQSGNWKLYGKNDTKIAEGQNAAGRVWMTGLGYDGTTVILSENKHGITSRVEYPLAGGTPKPFLKGVNWDRLYFSENTGHLMGYLRDEGELIPVFNNPEHTSAAAKARRAFSNLAMNMVDWTDDLNSMVVKTSGNEDSGTWYAVDIASLRANAIAYERLAIAPKNVGAISTFQYEASDGLKLDGILTLPPGLEAKNLPLVMMPHGGPHSYDSASFDWWAQAFASRGYAVFQPNFRGSTHKSQAFRAAGYGQWGRKMQSDKTDGLKALAASGIIDPERACIVGASYGGYAALAGVTLEQGIYKCAVAVAPVSDIKDMYQQDYRATGNDRTTKVSLLQQLGPRDEWDAVSPLLHAEQADAPIMLIHGKDDVVVPYSHSVKMADKLKDYAKPHELVTLDGEDHWLSRSQTRHAMLKAAVGFVEEHNPAK